MKTPAPPPSDAIAPSDPILSALKNYMAQCQKEHTARMDQDELGELIEHRAREIAAQPGEGERCPQCDSADLEWDVAYRNVSGGVVEGRLRTQDVRCVFVLGCNSCSETLKVVPAEQVRYSPPHVADALDGERIALAYGYLWHVNNPDDVPPGHAFTSPERAAYEARKVLRDMLTGPQRGAAINQTRELLAKREST